MKGQHLRYTAPLVHLDHPRGYSDPEKIRRHKAHIAAVRQRPAALDAERHPSGARPLSVFGKRAAEAGVEVGARADWRFGGGEAGAPLARVGGDRLADLLGAEPHVRGLLRDAAIGAVGAEHGGSQARPRKPIIARNAGSGSAVTSS